MGLPALASSNIKMVDAPYFRFSFILTKIFIKYICLITLEINHLFIFVLFYEQEKLLILRTSVSNFNLRAQKVSPSINERQKMGLGCPTSFTGWSLDDSNIARIFKSHVRLFDIAVRLVVTLTGFPIAILFDETMKNALFAHQNSQIFRPSLAETWHSPPWKEDLLPTTLTRARNFR